MFLADAYLHTLDPYAIQLTDTIGLRWYGLSYALGFVIAWLFFRWMAQTGRSPLTVQQVGDIMMYGIAGVIVGGRLGHVIFYGHGRPLLEFSDAFPYWEVLAINRGGMSAHGGVAGVILACLIYKWRHGVSSLHLLDLGAMISTVGLSIGRLANFLNAELWGKRLPQDLQADPPWWSIKYPQEVSLFQGEQLVQLGEIMPEVGVPTGDWLMWLSSRGSDEIEHLISVATNRLVSAVQDGNEVIATFLQPMLTAYYPSQLFQAITDGPILGGLLAIIWLRPRKPGVIGACFLLFYGILRIASEVFRQPDEGVALLLGLSRGQVLSILMILVPLIGLPIVMRRDVEKLGGWRRPERAPASK